jgi:dienelactone hydrolase
MASQASAEIPAEDSRNTRTPGTNTHAVFPEYKNLGEWEARKAHLRTQILSSAGLLPLPDRTPLHAQIFGRIENKDYSIEKVYLETLPGYYLGGNLYRPMGHPGKHPGVLTPHGHWTYGRLENQQSYSGPTLGINLARQGYVAFAYDMVGYNDTVQTPHSFGTPIQQLWSFGPLGLQLWNSIRALDFLASLDDVDPAKLGATGASGGGTQTFLLAAVDDRVQFAAPVNMVSAIMQGGDDCENAPNLRLGTNNMEIAAMFAPRPMLLVSATGDWTRNVPREEFPAIRRIYQLYGKADNVEVVQFEAEHNYNRSSREAVYKFLGQRVLGESDASKFREKNARIEMLQDMLVLSGRTLPDNALTYDKVFDRWKAIARKQADETRDKSVLRDRLSWALAAEWPAQVASEINGEQILLARPSVGDRISGTWVRGNGAPALVVHPGGAAAARNTDRVRQLIAAGRPVLLIDAFQTGPAVASRKRSERHFLAFNKTDGANRVQDILTALRFLTEQQRDTPELIGLDKAAIWVQFAAAIAPGPVRLECNLAGFTGSDQEFVDEFFVPGIQRAGGLAVARLLAPSR